MGSYDGNVDNVYNGHEVNGYNRAGARTRFELTPNDDLKVTLIADYMKASDDGPSGVITSTTSPAFANALRPVTPDSDNRKINSDYRTHVDDTNQGLSAQLDWNLGDYTLTSISAWRGWDNTQWQDGDRLSHITATIPSSHDKGELNYDQYSQELRLASPKGEFLEYVGGLYYMHAVDDETYRRVVTSTSTQNTGVADYGTRSDTYAWFYCPRESSPARRE